MKAAAAVLALAGFGATVSAAHAAPTATPRLTCTGFMDAFTKAMAPRKAMFERPLNITRGFSGDEAGIEVRVLSTGEDVDGTLKCRNEAFRRFEVRIRMPSNDKIIAAFKDYQQGALLAAFSWDKAKAATVTNALNSDAAEYLHASIQRGDTYLSGKVEYHQGDALDLGVIWTEQDRMLVITTQQPDAG